MYVKVIRTRTTLSVNKKRHASNMKNVLDKIDERLRTRVRIIIRKQWKKTKTRFEAPVKLGMSFELVYNCANTRKGYQQICKTRYIQFAINNDILKKRGLLLLTDHYLKVYTEIRIEPPCTERYAR